mmetsp:Transcript_2814/g.6733  ORF Transcript_2814/g.6733 Transcript_2814/m.6733 type:complete len:291 (-) Transcript_2814:71-943(-)
MPGTARYILLKEGDGVGDEDINMNCEGSHHQAFTPSFFSPYYAFATPMEPQESKIRHRLRAAAAVSMVAVMVVMCIGFTRSGLAPAKNMQGYRAALSMSSSSWESMYGSSSGDDSSSSSMGEESSSALGGADGTGGSSSSDSTSFYDELGGDDSQSGSGSDSSSLDSGDGQWSNTYGQQSDGSESNTQSLSGSRHKRHAKKEKKVKIVHNPNSVGSKLLKLSKEFDKSSSSSSDKTTALKNLAMIQKELSSDYKKVMGLGHAAKKAAEKMGLPKEKATRQAKLGGDPWSI